MRTSDAGGGVGVDETTGGGTAPAESWAWARAGRAVARTTAAVASNDDRTLDAMSEVAMMLSFRRDGTASLRGGLSQHDRLRGDGEGGGNGGVARRVLRVRGDGEGPGPDLGGAVAGGVGDPGGDARGVG